MLEHVPWLGQVGAWWRRVRGAGAAIREAERLRAQAEHDREKIDLLRQIADLHRQLDAARAEVAGLQAALREAQAQHVDRSSYQFHDNAYWDSRATGEAAGPFCAGCFDGPEKLAVRMTSLYQGYAECPRCKHKTKVHASDDDPPRPTRQPGGGWVRRY
jgi:hypothetical protein